MLQLRVNLPEEFELEDGVLTQAAIEWMTIYQTLLEKNGLTDFKVVRINS